MAWQHISPEVIVKCYKKCCISNAVDETDDVLWHVCAEDGNPKSVRMMKALSVKMETVTVIGRGDTI
jgi:hypothetical protein